MVQVKPFTVLVIGDSRLAEFSDCLRSLAAGDLVAAGTIESAAELLQCGSFVPDVVVFVQSWPGQFATGGVARIRSLAPLAAPLIMTGDWCAGDSRAFPAGVARIAAHQWDGRALSTTAANLAASVNLNQPATSTADDLLLPAACVPMQKRSGEIGIVADSKSTAEALADACRLRGYTPACFRSHFLDVIRQSNARMHQASNEWRGLIWDTVIEQAIDPVCVDRLRKSFANTPVIGLLDFPDRAQIDRARRAGIAAIIAKPVLIEELHWQLDRIIRTCEDANAGLPASR